MLKVFGWMDDEEQDIEVLRYLISELKLLLKEKSE